MSLLIVGFLSILCISGCDDRQWKAVIDTINTQAAEKDPSMNTDQPSNISPGVPESPAMLKPDTPPPPGRQVAMFGAGCFWGVEATFRKVPGVVDTAVGYSGGHTVNPSYKDVCTNRTGHAEVIRIEFDPTKVGYEQLLEVFWANHDPTTLNRQGPDVGTQYRSVIFTFSPEQEIAARQSKRQQTIAKRFRRPIVTIIAPAGPFYRAEEYHQRYLEKKGLENCHL